ncbi:MAG: type VI secretion system tube protein Hcp, partial [Nitrospirota bacterium]|nr:type VI secretion system tube protein Hcp [Nitrospirota bacterium]
DGAIPGNATLPGYENHIIGQDFSFAVAQAGEWEEGENITGRVTSFSDFTFSKQMDNASPALTLASARKTQFDNVVLNFIDASGNAFMTVTLEKVIVTSVGTKIKPGELRPLEFVTLSHRKDTWRVGTATTSYDLAAASDLTGGNSSALTAPTESSPLLNSTTDPSSTDSTPLRQTNKRTKKR